LQSEHERYLTEKHAKKPVVVMNYPKAIKAFYMRVNTPIITAFDAEAARSGSTCSTPAWPSATSIASTTPDTAICAATARHGAAAPSLTLPRSRGREGWGVLGRTLVYVTGLANVRDAIPVPRTPGNARY
jgi:asparaginyl-tRNA synthetase